VGGSLTHPPMPNCRLYNKLQKYYFINNN